MYSKLVVQYERVSYHCHLLADVIFYR